MKRLLTAFLCVAMLLSAAALPAQAADENLSETAAKVEAAEEDTDSKELAEVGAEVDELAETSYYLLTEEEFQVRMAEVRAEYPDGGLWQGVYYEDGNAKAWTCWGYGCQMIYEFFGGKFYAEGMYTNYISYSMDTLNAGDWVRIDYDSHTIFLTKITADGVYYTDGNGDGANGIRWDAFLSYEELRNRFSYKIHLPGNDLVGTEVIHTVTYDANGGNGTMSMQEVKPGESFTLKSNGFTRSGYAFSGYTVKRSFDNKWYTTDAGWQSAADIYDNGYTYKVYPQGNTYTLETPWLGSIGSATNFTFYAQWLPDYSTVEFMANYSGYNYILGSSLTGNYSDYIYSRDPSVYSVSVDSAERLNNSNSLKIVGEYAGESGSDLVIRTSTNYGYGDGFSQTGLVGDDKYLQLRFCAKSSVDGATMYIRWGFSSVYESVTLTTSWKTYYVPMPKTRFYGSSMHPFFDTAGTFYINSLTMGDDFNTNVVPETGDWAAEDQQVVRGGCITDLPTPVRDGYTFLGWYTAAEEGEKITATTPIEESRLRVYAHWRKNFSDTPVKTAELNGHTYEVYDNIMGWEEARRFCEDKGGHLLTIGSAEENAFAYNLINDRQGYCWIGLSYNTTQLEWQWVNYEDLTYANWYKSSYGTEDSGEYYALLYPMNYGTASYAATWDKCVGSEYHRSYYGYYNSFFICEYEEKGTLGDADGNGTVESLDVTCLQRYFASIATGVSEYTILINGDIDADGYLEITDATWVQRYLADMHTPYKIGEPITYYY